MSLTLNMTAGNDKDIIWFVKIEDGTNTYYFSTQDITLDSTWDGQVMDIETNHNSLDLIDQTINFEGGGSIGEIGSASFGITRYNANALTDGFFNEFYPATSGKVLTYANVSIGIAWTGATADSDITWFSNLYIDSYSSSFTKITVRCSEYSVLESVEIPYYEIQTDFDNGMSYFPDAPKENFGISIPIIYGDFSIYIDDFELFKPMVFPTICADRYSLKYICASHKLETEYLEESGSSVLYQYLSGLKTYMIMTCANGSATNTNNIAFANCFDTFISGDNIIYGRINIQLSIPGIYNQLTDFYNGVDDSSTTETEITAENPGSKSIAVKIDGGADNPGQLSRVVNSIILRVTVADVGVSSFFQMGYFNKEYNSGAGNLSTGTTYTASVGDYDYDLSNDFSAREDSDKPWTIDELINYEYILFTVDGNSITVSNLYLLIDNIVVADPRSIVGRVGQYSRIGQYRNDQGKRIRPR